MLGVQFRDLSLILEITSPTGVQLVEHSGLNNFLWGTPICAANPPPSGGYLWSESHPGPPTTRLRIRDEVASVNRPGDGRTHRVGLHGLTPGLALNIRAIVIARTDNVPTSSCALQIQNLHIGDRIEGSMD